MLVVPAAAKVCTTCIDIVSMHDVHRHRVADIRSGRAAVGTGEPSVLVAAGDDIADSSERGLWATDPDLAENQIATSGDRESHDSRGSGRQRLSRAACLLRVCIGEAVGAFVSLVSLITLRTCRQLTGLEARRE